MNYLLLDVYKKKFCVTSFSSASWNKISMVLFKIFLKEKSNSLINQYFFFFYLISIIFKGTFWSIFN